MSVPISHNPSPRYSVLITAIIFTILLLSGCHRNKVTDTTGDARKKSTDMPELPFILEGDYTPDTGVMYKVIIGKDTCFVTIDSLDENQMHGFYYQLVDGSDCVERRYFSKDIHWRDKRAEALVYIYENPPYKTVNDPRFRRETHPVKVLKDLEYGQALGYWTSMKDTEDESYGEIIADGLRKGFFKSTQSLTMDIYQPADKDTAGQLRPLVMLIHGGGFYVGDKQDSAIRAWCRHFAATGYVAVSINYRMGFIPSKGDIARTGYMALQDAHAAMRYMVDHAGTYNIDTNLIFVGGCSAGAITSLNLAFMRDKDRPKHVVSKQRKDLGAIATSGNSSHATFHIKAVANMWGAITDLNMLKNSNTDIISFHGDADQVVPYDNGYPFNDISKRLGRRLFDRMYGSLPIDKKARELGLHSELHTFPGEGHSLHHYADGTWNQKNYLFIRDKMTQFFYYEIAGSEPVIEDDRNDNRHFVISDESAKQVAWLVEGGFITHIGHNEIWVVWRDDAPQHKLHATGRNNRGFGFVAHRDISIAEEVSEN